MTKSKKRKKKLGPVGKATVKLVGIGVGAGIKAHTKSELVSALGSAGAEKLSEEVLTAIKNHPDEVLGISVLGVSAIIWAPALLIGAFFQPNEDLESGNGALTLQDIMW